MPMLPSKPCGAPGCGALAVRGAVFCEKHAFLALERERRRKAAASRSRDRAAHRLYSTAAWVEGRRAYLAENPLCLDCLARGVLEPATDVDHVIPHKGNRALFFDQKNWRGFCHSCHSKKTTTQDGGFGNPTGK